jgi:CNT family concentrative nucleoside transporter
MDATLVAQSAFGFLVLHALAWAVSENRRGVIWRPVVAGMSLTLVLAALLLKVPVFAEAFLVLNRAVEALERATQAGTSFVFGYLGGAPLPFEEKPATSSFCPRVPRVALVIVISALSSLLFYWRVLPWVVALRAPARAHDGRAARSACPPRPTCSSAWSRRRSSCGRTSRGCRARSSS